MQYSQGKNVRFCMSCKFFSSTFLSGSTVTTECRTMLTFYLNFHSKKTFLYIKNLFRLMSQVNIYIPVEANGASLWDLLFMNLFLVTVLYP